MLRQFRLVSVLTVLLLGLPMVGVWLGGAALDPYLEFPPRTRHVEHASFSWPLFALTAAVGLAALSLLVRLVLRDRKAAMEGRVPAPATWPWWGWLGLVLLFVSWILAWNRFPWFVDWQWATFTPLWLGYILVVNAWTWRREGQCLMVNQRRYFLALFPLSSLFWWYFEYLNRFVQNWFYLGVDDFSPWRYVLHATIAFSTVLPAVLSTSEWLRSLLRLQPRALNVELSQTATNRVGWILLVASSVALLFLGVWPNLLFPFLWFAPLLLLLGMQGLHGEPQLITELRQRGWQTIYLPALATLQCGFLWELWNFKSAAKWIYDVPFVHRYQVFEMPIVGFTGYLPFGIECLVIGLLLRTPDKEPASR